MATADFPTLKTPGFTPYHIYIVILDGKARSNIIHYTTGMQDIFGWGMRTGMGIAARVLLVTWLQTLDSMIDPVRCCPGGSFWGDTSNATTVTDCTEVA